MARNRRTHDGGWRAFSACERRRARRRRARRGSQFGPAEWALVEELIALDWSPEQVAGWLRLHELLAISYETIYLLVWRDKHAGGELWRHMRQAGKRRRKRYGAYDSRGRLAGKRHISERPAEVERARSSATGRSTRSRATTRPGTAWSPWSSARPATLMGKLARHRAADATARTTELIGRHEGRVAP